MAPRADYRSTRPNKWVPRSLAQPGIRRARQSSASLGRMCATAVVVGSRRRLLLGTFRVRGFPPRRDQREGLLDARAHTPLGRSRQKQWRPTRHARLRARTYVIAACPSLALWNGARPGGLEAHARASQTRRAYASQAGYRLARTALADWSTADWRPLRPLVRPARPARRPAPSPAHRATPLPLTTLRLFALELAFFAKPDLQEDEQQRATQADRDQDDREQFAGEPPDECRTQRSG